MYGTKIGKANQTFWTLESYIALQCVLQSMYLYFFVHFEVHLIKANIRVNEHNVESHKLVVRGDHLFETGTLVLVILEGAFVQDGKD